ncbi:MAG: hypothetical protein K6G42_04795 [Lachnospiraceae bacterium]|nr:hypothetical protein [Lachnospiraceae bacterium]
MEDKRMVKSDDDLLEMVSGGSGSNPLLSKEDMEFIRTQIDLTDDRQRFINEMMSSI